MSFASGHLLSYVVSAFFSAFGGFNRLAIDDAGTGFGLPALLDAHFFVQGSI
jgi:hypothetical protein